MSKMQATSALATRSGRLQRASMSFLRIAHCSAFATPSPAPASPTCGSVDNDSGFERKGPNDPSRPESCPASGRPSQGCDRQPPGGLSQSHALTRSRLLALPRPFLRLMMLPSDCGVRRQLAVSSRNGFSTEADCGGIRQPVQITDWRRSRSFLPRAPEGAQQRDRIGPAGKMNSLGKLLRPRISPGAAGMA